MPTELDDTQVTSFPGFDIPRQNWFKMPNNWTDITADISSIAELKVVEYVLKHTWGYQEYGMRKRITNDEFMHGRRRKDGARMDKGTGLSKPSVIAGLKAAVERGLLIEQVDDSDKARVKKYYSLRMMPDFQDESMAENDQPPAPSDPTAGEELGVKDLNAGVKNLYSGVKNFYPRGKDSLPRTEKDTLERHFKKERTNNNSGAPPTPSAVVVALTHQGISEKIAQRLAEHYSEQRIEEKLDYLAFLQQERPATIANPRGWLRKAIEEDYGPPDGYLSAADRARKADEAAALDELQARAEQQRQALATQRTADQEAFRRQLHKRYGTTEEDERFWQEVCGEFQHSQPHLHQLFTQAHILTCTQDAVQLGFAVETWLHQLDHPVTRAALARTLKSLVGRPLTVETVLIAEQQPEPG